MARFDVGRGLDDYIALLGNLEYSASPVIGMAIYDGAKVVADKIRANIEALPVYDGHYKRGVRRDPKQVEIDGMLDGLGIAKKQVDGSYINVKIGMDGYNADVTDEWPRGKPNAMIARSIESGTTFVKRNPFITRAVNAAKNQAEDAMRERFDTETEKIMTK